MRVARLPLSALFSEGGDPSLYVVDDKGELALKPVAVKSYESNDVVITGGVNEGAKVVVLGVQKLDPTPEGPGRLLTVLLREDAMKRFNLSGWAVSHPALILFLIIALGAAGFFSYQRLGRAEDPFFTVKVVNISAIWPGATAAEMQTQVADPIEKKLQELPYFEKVQTYSKPAFTAMQVTFKDSTPPKDVPYLFYVAAQEAG